MGLFSSKKKKQEQVQLTPQVGLQPIYPPVSAVPVPYQTSVPVRDSGPYITQPTYSPLQPSLNPPYLSPIRPTPPFQSQPPVNNAPFAQPTIPSNIQLQPIERLPFPFPIVAQPQPFPQRSPAVPFFYRPELGTGSALMTVGWPGITCPTHPTAIECQKIATLTGLKPELIEQLSNEFQNITQGSGYLDLSKFQTMFLVTICGPAASSASKLATNLFSTFDSNHSGKLDFSEFVLAFKTLAAERQAMQGLTDGHIKV